MPRDREAHSFALADDQDAPALPPEQLDAISRAAQAIDEVGFACSYVLVDLQTGRGISGNADEALYTASSYKAPLTFFLIQGGNDFERDLAEASILYSDNDSYEALASPYMDDRFITWLHEHGIDYDEWSPWYPTANAAGMASCWTDIYRYLRSGESDAPWLEEMHANTNVSFVRDALEGQDVRVLNKAGWLADDEYNAVADCGIIETQGRSYLIAVLSSQPSYGEAHERVKELVRALFDSRDSLS